VSNAFGKFNIAVAMPELKLLLPVGISFYTFQVIGYIMDIYYERKEPEVHLGIYALYVAFFPQLVAGPIERSTHLMPQFKERHYFDYARVTDGLKLMAWGYFKKLVIADNVAIVVNHLYRDPSSHSGLSMMIATYLFAFQILCDFSGYTDIARGGARVMGYDLMENFRQPYLSRSVLEFWKKWHISLSSWFRDYLYIPLGGNRVSRIRWAVNIAIVFLLSGLWHGAAWTFVVWGGLHAIYLLIAVGTKDIFKKFSNTLGVKRFPFVTNVLSVLITFNLVTFAWIFFRAENISDAFYIVSHLLDWSGTPFSTELRLVGMGNLTFVLLILFIISMETVTLIKEHFNIRNVLFQRPFSVRWAMYSLLVLTILYFGNFASHEFIYFQF